MSNRRPRTRIDSAPTQLRLVAIPIISVMLGSLTALLPIITSAPILPPFGFMILIAWRLLHRTLWPVWMTLPLGLFDDMFSGQPIGSALFLWTLAFLTVDLFDRRMLWRDFWQEWGMASALTCLLLILQLVIANSTGNPTRSSVLVPQMILSILLIPLITRLCARIDLVRRSA
jgi:rod shape-determining protein MreD